MVFVHRLTGLTDLIASGGRSQPASCGTATVTVPPPNPYC
jgi:hypothetical protein